jgi:5-methyltetrahydropteroyltriglutamate--homocysteine methyltransferase
MINTAIDNRPADMTITMHLCRGNFRSSWIAQGGYEPVAEILFNQIGANGYFMEFDTERAGGFEPLRFVPKNKTVVLGLVTSKAGALESQYSGHARPAPPEFFRAARAGRAWFVHSIESLQ